MVTEALAVGSAFEMAVKVTNGGLGKTLGARYESFAISPHAEPEQPNPVTFHSTAFHFAPITVAVTTCDPPTGTCNSPGGEMLT